MGDVEKTLWDQFHLLKKLSNDHDIDLALPRILMAGAQSAGKTMAISTLVGFPVGFSQSGTGNKCVTEYNIVNDDACPEPLISIRWPEMNDGRMRQPVDDCSVKELHYHMRQFMESMNKITADVIHVTIRSANQQDLVVVDPPGLLLTPTANEEEMAAQNNIRKAMVYHMRQPSTFTYFLASMPSDFMAFADLRIFYDLVREAEPSWRLDDTSKFGIVVNKIDQRQTDVENAIENEKFHKVMCDDEYQFFYVSLNPRGANVENQSVDQVRLFKDHGASEAQWIAEHITRHLARTSASFQSMFNRDIMPRFSMMAVRKDMQEKMLSVFRSSLNDVRSKLKNMIQDAKNKKDVLTSKIEGMTGETDDVEHSARMFVEHMLCMMHFMDVRIPSMTGAAECFTYRAEIDIDGTKVGKTLSEMLQMGRPVPGVILTEQELRDSLMREAPMGDQYTLLTLDDRMTGFFAIDNLKKIFEYNLLARNITVYSRSEISAMGAGVHHRDNFNPMNVVRRVVAEQITNNTAAVHWFFDTVEQLLDHMTELVCKKISMLPTATETQHTIIRIIREAYLEYIRKELLLRISRLWEDLLDISRDYVPTDIWTKTVMLLIQCPMVRIIASQDNLDAAFEETANLRRSQIAPSGNGGPRRAMSIMKRADGRTWEEAQDEVDVEEKHRRRYVSKASELQKIYNTFQLARSQNLFSTADTVEGGMQMPKPADEQAFEAKYVNELCLFYYRQVQTQLIHDFDKAYNRYFKEPLSPAEIRAPADLVNRIMRMVDENDEVGSLMEAMANEREGLEKQLVDTEQEIRDLIHVLNSTTAPVQH